MIPGTNLIKGEKQFPTGLDCRGHGPHPGNRRPGASPRPGVRLEAGCAPLTELLAKAREPGIKRHLRNGTYSQDT